MGITGGSLTRLPAALSLSIRICEMETLVPTHEAAMLIRWLTTCKCMQMGGCIFDNRDAHNFSNKRYYGNNTFVKILLSLM